MAELFESFEARQRTGASMWRRVLRWLAGSVALHLLFVASVVYVPALQSALQLANMFSGMEYGDEDYELQNLGGEGVTMLRASDMFQYPAGYFTKNIPPAPLKPAQPTPTPKPKPSPSATPAPTPKPTASPSPAVSPSPNATPQTEEVASNATATAENVQEKIKSLPKVNSRPFTDFFVRTKKAIDAGELDLSVPIRLSVEADRTPDGQLVRFRNWSVVPNSPQHQKLAREFVAIISASKAFLYIDGVKSITLSGRIDASTVYARVLAPTDSAETAAKQVSGYNLLLTGVRFARRGKNEEVFLNNTKVRPIGRNIQVELSMPRSLASEVIAKQLPPS